MTGEATQLVRRSVKAFADRDVEGMWAVFHPDSEFRSAFGAMEGKVYRGQEDIARYFQDIDDTFEDWHLEDIAYHSASNDQVVLTYRIVGRGKGSGFPVDAPIAILWQIRDGLLWRGAVYLNQSEALSAAGISGADAER